MCLNQLSEELLEGQLAGPFAPGRTWVLPSLIPFPSQDHRVRWELQSPFTW